MTQTVQRSCHQLRTVAAWVVPRLQLWLNPVPWKWNNTLELNYKGLKEPGINLNHTSDFICLTPLFTQVAFGELGYEHFMLTGRHWDVCESYLWMLWLGAYQWQLLHDVAAGKSWSCQDGAAECLLFLFPEGGNVEGVRVCVKDLWCQRVSGNEMKPQVWRGNVTLRKCFFSISEFIVKVKILICGQPGFSKNLKEN